MRERSPLVDNGSEGEEYMGIRFNRGSVPDNKLQIPTNKGRADVLS